MSQLRRRRALVFIDQRGTGDSQPLDCNLSANPGLLQNYFDELFPVEKVRACRAALERISDLKLYTTPVAVSDLDEARVALGYDKINLYGISYGSLIALQYLRQYPGNVRALALAGVTTPAAKLPLQYSGGAQYALDKLMQDCAVDDACRAAYPDLDADFAKTLAKFNRGPVTFRRASANQGIPECKAITERLRRAAKKPALQCYYGEPGAIDHSPRRPRRLDSFCHRSVTRSYQFPSRAGNRHVLDRQLLGIGAFDRRRRDRAGNQRHIFRRASNQDTPGGLPRVAAGRYTGRLFCSGKFTCARPDAIRTARQRDPRSSRYRSRSGAIEQSPDSSARHRPRIYLCLCRKHHRSVHHNRLDGRFEYRLRGKIATPGISNRTAGALPALRPVSAKAGWLSQLQGLVSG